MSAMKGLSSVWNRVVSRDRWAARPFHARGDPTSYQRYQTGDL